MRKFFTLCAVALTALAINAQTEQLKTGDHFSYTGSDGVTRGYTIVGDNLIPNPSFDNGVDNWLGGDGNALGSATWNSTGGVDGGAYIIPQTNSGKGGNASIGTAWALEIGKTYVFSYYINNTSNTAAVEKEGYIVTSQTNTPRGDETLTLMYAHEDADLAWTQNIVVTEAKYNYLQFCARWLNGAHGFDAFILAEVEQDADPTELAELVELCTEVLDSYDEPDEESYATFESMISEANGMVLDYTEFTAVQFNEMIAALKEALLDYQMANADDDHIVDVTDRYIKNPKFDNGMVDWERNNDAVNGGTNIRVQHYFQEITDRVLEINGLPGVDTYIRQSVKGLPRGYYIFSVQCVMTHSAGETEPTGCYIFCNGAEQDMKTAEMTGSDAGYADSHPETFSIRGVVTEDSIVVGMMGKTDGLYSYVAIDNVKLEYAGFNVGIYLQALCEEIEEYLAEHADEILPMIAADLEDEMIEAMGVLGSEDDIMTAEYDKLSNIYKQAQNSVLKMQELSNVNEQLLELLNNTTYPGAEAALAVYEEAQNLIDGNDDEAKYQDILDMIAKVEQAIKDYKMSQEASHDNPADYSFFITNPELYTSNEGWTGSNPGYQYNVAEFYNMDWDMYQTITGLPNGLYEVGLTGFFRTGANDGGDAYRAGSENLLAKLYANSSVTSIMSLYTFTSGEAGCSDDGVNGYINVRQYADEAFTNGFYTTNAVKVIVTDGTLKIGVRGSNHENTSWFAFRDFTLKYFGEATDEDKQEMWNSAQTEANSILEGLLPGDKADFNEAINAAKALSDVMEGYEKLVAANEEYEKIAADTKTFLAGNYATAQAASDAVSAAAAAFTKAAIEKADAKSTILEGIDTKLAAYLDYAEYVAEVKDLVAAAAKNKYDAKYVTVVTDLLTANEDILKEEFRTADVVADRKARLEAAVAAMKKSALTSVAAGTDVSDLLIANPNIDSVDGWSIILGTGNQPSITGQYWTGDANNRYLDSWNGTAGKLNFTAYQILTDIPNGTYTLECHGRSSGNNAFMFANTASYADEKNDSTMAINVAGGDTKWALFPNDADTGGELWLADSLLWVKDGTTTDVFNAHDGSGFGWAIRTIEGITVTDHVMTIGITCDSTLTGKPFDGTWFSADEFRLTITALGDNSNWTIETQVANIVAGEAEKVEYFTIDGRQAAEPQKGLNVIRTINKDGSISVKKVFIR
ncbi:MAG: hypothetical protein J5814_03540 [Bacteroidaceae bacterium]|nr:hypothetical protein [Bacteroidaceae bacterium]